MSAPAPAAVPVPTPAEPAPPPRRRPASGGFLFVVPFLVFYALFTLVPVGWGFGMSFQQVSLVGAPTRWAGLDNYAELFGDAMVWTTLGHTLLFTVLSTVPLVLVALVTAVLVHTGVRGQWFWRFTIFAPYLLPVSTVVLIWNWLMQGDFGFLNQALTAVGLPAVGWLSSESVALLSVVLITVWWTVGFNFLLYLAALQAIPATVYEAAAIDGAGGWRRAVSITLPLLAPTTALVVVLQILSSLKLFDQAYILFGGSGGPGQAAAPVLQYVYDTGFVNYRLGYASAISYVFFALVVAVSLGQFWLTRRRARSVA
ncbi:carbohydrate ABC transporter permease [Kineococcus gynurae]|uniref:Carbohydrate ABC transporter permease n=1 Tax=Kineococcus gynurae TaxID=452979 RepID=A0ABV5LXB0_9ACTN